MRKGTEKSDRQKTLTQSERGRACVQHKRALRAGGIVIALGMILIGSGSIYEKCSAQAHFMEYASMIESMGVVESGGCDQRFSVEDAQDVPAWFTDEVISLDNYKEVRVASQGAVVGFLASGSAKSVFRALSATLAYRGWTGVESGVAGWGTFMKDDGVCRWIAVSCTDVADSVSVVVQCAVPYAEKSAR